MNKDLQRISLKVEQEAHYEGMSPRKFGLSTGTESFTNRLGDGASPIFRKQISKNDEGVSTTSRSHMNRVMMFAQAPPMSNDIKPLTLAKQIRMVNLDMESPRLKKALERLGLVRDDLNNTKRMDDFAFDFDKSGDRLPADNKIVELRFKHYQRKMMERINRVLSERKAVIDSE